jgi:hypothetical protein
MENIKKKISRNNLFMTFCKDQFNLANVKLEEADLLLDSIEKKLKEANSELEEALKIANLYLASEQLCPRRIYNFNIAVNLKTLEIDRLKTEEQQAKNEYKLAKAHFLKMKLQDEIYINKNEAFKMKLNEELLSIQDKNLSDLYNIRKGINKCL